MTIFEPSSPARAHRDSRAGSGSARSRLFVLASACLLTCGAALAQQQQQQQQQQAQQQATVTPNFRDADLASIIDAVGQITGKTFLLDPRTRGVQVTILSSTPVSPDAFYQIFLSILAVHGFIAVPSGNVVKILPDANARQLPAHDLPSRVPGDSDEIVTQVIPVRNVSAAQLVPVLRPLIPQYGHLVAYQPSNMLIISDRAANVNRMMRIIERIDQAGDDAYEIIRLENASAGEIVRVVNALAAGAGPQAEQGGASPKLVADDRTNSVIITGEQSGRLRLKTLVAHLDTPLETGGDTQVWYLNYADAEQIAGKLKEQVTGITAPAPGQPAPPGGAPPVAASERGATTIWADPQMNALVVTAPPKIMRQLRLVVDKLDIRRLQVLVEAILVDISEQKTAELGVNWAVGSTDSDSTVPIGTFNQPVGGASIGSIAAIVQDPENLADVPVPSGLTLGAGRFGGSGVSFAVLLRALRGDTSTNILQTPSIITLDNEEAEIKVAQEVPFLTGQFTNTGAAQGQVTPFQTIQREEVGTILKITPQITDDNSVMLKIEQEDSSVAQGTQGAVDLITNKRTFNTTVLVDDGGVVVIGGLITDQAREGENRVPVLGSIPILGELFKTRSGNKEKRNLMLFVRPTIIRDRTAAAIETNAKYNVVRDQQLQRRKGRVTLLPGERQPLLPPIEDLSKYADPTAGAQEPAPGTEKPAATPPVQTEPLTPPGPTPQPSPQQDNPVDLRPEPEPPPR